MSNFLNSPWSGRLLRGLALIAAVFCLWQASGSLRSSKEAQATVAAVSRSTLKTQPIASLRVGQRVLADNPELAGPALPDSDIEPRDWRRVRLVMEKPNGGEIEIELLRPVDWLLKSGLQGIEEHPAYLLPRPVVAAVTERPLCEVLVGRTIHLDLPEMGASGPAVVAAIAPCPEIEPARRSGRRVITGTFHHSAGNVIDLQIEGEPQPLGVTDNHPFWSEDRHEFIPAGELHQGERLRKADDTLTQVTRITPRTGPPVPVYNLEVDAEHVYFVGQNGTLVHNTYKTYITYIGTEAESGLRYIGRASGIGSAQEILNNRLRNHHISFAGLPNIDNTSLSYEAIRGREQQLIGFFGLGNLANKINGISPNNGRIDEYMKAAIEQFGSP